jgi:hypothetical protein
MKNKTVLLLLNKNSAKNNNSIKIWLRKSGFKIREVPDVFRAMEEISDFTVQISPEVILIEAFSPQNDFCLIRQIIPTNDEISIFALSENVINHRECFEGNLAQVKAKFSLLHSKAARAKAAV